MARYSTTYRTHYYTNNNQKPYSFWGFLFDVMMVFMTGGIWLIWIFVREMRKR